MSGPGTVVLRESGLGRWTWSSALVFVLGALMPVQVELVGVVYVGELFLFAVAVWAVTANLTSAPFWDRSIVCPLSCLALTFLGYVLSDLINDTGTVNILRGWARIVFLGSNILALYFLCRKKPLNLIVFCLGVSAAMVSLNDGRDLFSHYKLALALPVTLSVLCLGALIRNRGRYLTISAALAVVGVLHIWMDFRSLGAICILAGAIVFSKTTERSKVRGLYAMLLMAAITAGSAILFYSYGFTQDSYAHRREESDHWRLAAGTAALDAIGRAPIVGNGSWATSSQILKVFDASFAESAGRRQSGHIGMELAGHSQFLQAWYEAGVLGLVFFLYFAFSLMHALWICVFRVQLDALMPFAILSCWLSLYNIGFSPFAGGHRIHMAISVVVAETVRRNWRSMSGVKNDVLDALREGRLRLTPIYS